MSRREDVTNDVWDRLDELSNDAILLYLWSWTNKRCGMAGIYRVPRRMIAEGRLGDGDRLDAALAELEGADLVYYRDRVLWCKDRVEGLGTKTVQIAKAIRSDLANVEDNELVYAFAEKYADHKFGDLLRELPDEKGKGGLDLRQIRRGSREVHETAQSSQVVNLRRGSVVGDRATAPVVAYAPREDEDVGYINSPATIHNGGSAD